MPYSNKANTKLTLAPITLQGVCLTLLLLTAPLVSVPASSEMLSIASDELVISSLSNHQVSNHCAPNWRNRQFDRQIPNDAFFLRSILVTLYDHGVPVSLQTLSIATRKWIYTSKTSDLKFTRPDYYDSDRFAVKPESTTENKAIIGDRIWIGGLGFSENDMLFCLAFEHHSKPHYLSITHGGDRRLSHPEQVIYQYSGEVYLSQNKETKIPIQDNAYLIVRDLGEVN